MLRLLRQVGRDGVLLQQRQIDGREVLRIDGRDNLLEDGNSRIRQGRRRLQSAFGADVLTLDVGNHVAVPLRLKVA